MSFVIVIATIRRLPQDFQDIFGNIHNEDKSELWSNVLVALFYWALSALLIWLFILPFLIIFLGGLSDGIKLIGGF